METAVDAVPQDSDSSPVEEQLKTVSSFTECDFQEWSNEQNIWTLQGQIVEETQTEFQTWLNEEDIWTSKSEKERQKEFEKWLAEDDE